MKDCPKKSRNNDSRQKNDKKQPEKSKMCAEKNKKLLVISGFIEDIAVEKLALDIGATRSILAARVVMQLGIKLNPERTKVRLADERVIETIGSTDNLTVKIKSHECTLRWFLVFGEMEYDALLGLDFFDQTDAGVFPKQRILQFPHGMVDIPAGLEDEDALPTLLAEMVGEEDDDDDLTAEHFMDWSGKNKSIKPEMELPESAQNKFEKLTSMINEATAVNYKDLNGGSKVGEFTIGESTIELIENRTIYVHPYRRSEVEMEAMAKIADELMEAGIIRLSASPHCSQFFVIKKKDGTFRPIIDYRVLNKFTKRIDWPLPRIDDLLKKPRNASVYSRMDAKTGFFQIPVNEASKAYTAFSDGLRKFEWNFMPMGVMNAPMVFAMIMN